MHGELWSAHSEQPVEAGQTLRVTAVDGLTLAVEPIDDTEQ
jgi:membrane-bound serine protease (ClpP class)